MQSFLPLQILFLGSALICQSFAYDLSFNTDRDLNLWKFNGSYIYSRSLQDIAPLVPVSLLRSAGTAGAGAPRKGLWLIRYGGPEAENFLTLQYSLHHHLLVQGLVQFIATPNIPVVVTTNDGVEVGKFWSDGKTWCDAIFNVNMLTQIKIDISTPNSGNYALIDKVVLGVQGNLTQLNGRDIHPCKTSPPVVGTVDEDDLAPDMAQKSVATRQSYQSPPPPDMASKPAYHGNVDQGGVPDMRASQRQNQPPKLDTRTTTDNQNGIVVDNNDSSDVKCGCSCSCSRQKTKKQTNGTMESG